MRRDLYALPDRNPHPFVVANRLVSGSYVSLQMALAYYHLIPEHTAVVTSVKLAGKLNELYARLRVLVLLPGGCLRVETLC